MSMNIQATSRSFGEVDTPPEFALEITDSNKDEGFNVEAKLVDSDGTVLSTTVESGNNGGMVYYPNIKDEWDSLTAGDYAIVVKADSGDPVPTQTINYPYSAGDIIYTGVRQSPEFINYDSSKMTMTGQTEGIDIGSYIVAFTPKDGYVWIDGTTTSYPVSWRIVGAPKTMEVSPTQIVLSPKKRAAIIYVEGVGPDYEVIDGTGGSVQITNYPDQKYVYITGVDFSNTNMGSIAIRTIDKSQTIFVNISADELITAAIPYYTETIVYNGHEQYPKWITQSSTIDYSTGQKSATEVGTYEVTFYLFSGYKWEDGTTGPKTLTWKIEAAQSSGTESCRFQIQPRGLVLSWDTGEAKSVNITMISGSGHVYVKPRVSGSPVVSVDGSSYGTFAPPYGRSMGKGSSMTVSVKQGCSEDWYEQTAGWHNEPSYPILDICVGNNIDTATIVDSIPVTYH